MTYFAFICGFIWDSVTMGKVVSFYTFLVVIFLALMLVSNESIGKKYQSRALTLTLTLTWTIFAACGTIYLNFLIPHIAHSIKPF